MTKQLHLPGFEISKHAWASNIVQSAFETGALAYLKSLRSLKRGTGDVGNPVLRQILNAWKDERLSTAFVTFWKLGQTLATLARFWLESAIIRIIAHQAKHLDRRISILGTQAVLARKKLSGLRNLKPLEMFGEERHEYKTRTNESWREEISQKALDTIGVLVDREERTRPDRERPAARTYRDHDWSITTNDRETLRQVAASVAGPSLDEVNLHCNLLIVEPDPHDRKPHAWAIRYINPKMLADHARRKQERVNLLRLHALLVQAKIVRDPESIRVCVAELLPRDDHFARLDKYPDYFSPETYWSAAELWKGLLHVPIDAVLKGIEEAGKRIKGELTRLLGDKQRAEGARGTAAHGEEREHGTDAETR